MIILIDRSFQKDAKRLPSDVQRKLKQLIQEIQQANSFSQIGVKNYPAIKMLIGYALEITGLGFIKKMKRLSFPGFSIEKRFTDTFQKSKFI